MKALGKLALNGLVTLLPVALTVYILWRLGSGAEALLGRLLRRVLPEALYLPGAGLVLGLGLLILVGLFMRIVLAQRLAALVDRMLDRIPLVKTVYGAVSDLISLFSRKTEQRVDHVVLVHFASPQIQLLGLVTRPAMPDLDPAPGEDPISVVYIPMSYGLGGFTALVRRSALTPVKMTVADALRFAVTAGAPQKGQ